MALCRFSHAFRAKYIVAHRLPGVLAFHQRHMLVSRCMKHDVRTVASEDTIKHGNVLDIANHAGNGHLGKFCPEFLFDLVKQEFGMFQQHQQAWLKTNHLANEFRTD